MSQESKNDVLLLTQSQLREHILLNMDAVDCVENAFRLLAQENIVMPDVLRMDMTQSNGEVDVKTAYVPSLDSFAIKVSPGFFDNPKIGLPSLNGLMILLSAKTGMLESMLLDNGWLTAVRTAAAGAVASKWLSNPDASKVAVIGAGEQARLQLQALTLVRDIKTAKVWAPNIDSAKTYAQQMSEKLSIAITACSSIDEAMQDVDIAITATPSSKPLIQTKHLQPGLHITAMGSDAEHKNEIHPLVLKQADLYVCDSFNQTKTMGELHHALKAGLFTEQDSFQSLGEVIVTQNNPRTDVNNITICDLTGTGIQDTAIANMAYTKALQLGLGSKLQV